MALSCRVVEVAFLQICDFLWDMDAVFHVQYVGTTAVRIYRRKQDTKRTGHYPRVRSARAKWDLVQRLKQHAETHGLAVSEQCTKAESPGARCRFCPPFFFTEALERGSMAGPKVKEMLSRQQVINTVISSLALIGVDTTHYSGLSMWRGGAALMARVQELVMFLQ